AGAAGGAGGPSGAWVGGGGGGGGGRGSPGGGGGGRKWGNGLPACAAITDPARARERLRNRSGGTSAGILGACGGFWPRRGGKGHARTGCRASGAVEWMWCRVNGCRWWVWSRSLYEHG